MAQRGIIPRRLAKCPTPVCTACLYGKATKRPWRSKVSSEEQRERFIATKPGEVVSVDMMTSPTPGFVAQMLGKLTTQRYHYATVYVDQATGLGYTWLQKTASAEETVKGKKAFERYCASQGIKVQHYHADNGIFASNDWHTDCIKHGQGLSFAGVNAHHQNGVAERRIKELQHRSRTMLIHAYKRWPDAVSANLWPYAVRMANDAINARPNLKFSDGRSPLEAFAKTKVVSNPKHWQHFCVPVYTLARELQGSTGIFHKWKQQFKVGLYLGRFPQH